MDFLGRENVNALQIPYNDSKSNLQVDNIQDAIDKLSQPSGGGVISSISSSINGEITTFNGSTAQSIKGSGLIISNGQMKIEDGLPTAPSLSFKSDPTSGIFKNGNDIAISNSGVQRMKVSDTGILIGEGIKHPSSLLDINSTTQAFRFPRMTTIERDVIIPTEGLTIYNTDSKTLQVYTGLLWSSNIIESNHNNLINIGTNSHDDIDLHISEDDKHRIIDDLSSSTTTLYSGQKIQNEVDLLTTDINDNKSNITNNSNSISTNQTNIATNLSSIQSNDTDILNNSNSISTNQSNIATNLSSIQSNDTDILNNSNSISTNQTNIATNLSSINSNDTDILNNTNSISTNQTNIATNLSSINSNSSNITNNSNSISTNQTNISTNLNSIQSNDTDILNNTNSISTNQTNISSNLSSINSNSSNITNNSNSISTNQTNISTNLNSIQSNDTDILNNTNSISTNQTNISSNLSSINSNSSNITNNSNLISTNQTNINSNLSSIQLSQSNITTNSNNLTSHINNTSIHQTSGEILSNSVLTDETKCQNIVVENTLKVPMDSGSGRQEKSSIRYNETDKTMEFHDGISWVPSNKKEYIKHPSLPFTSDAVLSGASVYSQHGYVIQSSYDGSQNSTYTSYLGFDGNKISQALDFANVQRPRVFSGITYNSNFWMTIRLPASKKIKYIKIINSNTAQFQIAGSNDNITFTLLKDEQNPITYIEDGISYYIVELDDSIAYRYFVLTQYSTSNPRLGEMELYEDITPSTSSDLTDHINDSSLHFSINDEGKVSETSVWSSDKTATFISDEISAVETVLNNNLNSHITDFNNPHSVSKSQVGLSNVQNLSLSEILTNPNITGNLTTNGLIDGVDIQIQNDLNSNHRNNSFIHRSINDNISTAVDLWSSNKISSELTTLDSNLSNHVNTSSIHLTKSQLLDDVQTTTRFKVPSYTSSEILSITGSQNGDIIYDNEKNRHFYFKGGFFKELGDTTQPASAPTNYLWTNRNISLSTPASVSHNVIIGDESCIDMDTSSQQFLANVAVGWQTMRYGKYVGNVAVGYLSQVGSPGDTTSRNDNTSVGIASLQVNRSGFGNTSVGGYSAYRTEIGNNNTCIGFRSCFSNNLNNDSNVCIGSFSDVSGNSTTNGISVGHQAIADTNECVIGNSSINVIKGMSNLTCDIGSLSNRYKDIYANTVNLTQINNSQTGNVQVNSDLIINSANNLIKNSVVQDMTKSAHCCIYHNTQNPVVLSVNSLSNEIIPFNSNVVFNMNNVVANSIEIIHNGSYSVNFSISFESDSKNEEDLLELYNETTNSSVVGASCRLNGLNRAGVIKSDCFNFILPAAQNTDVYTVRLYNLTNNLVVYTVHSCQLVMTKLSKND